VEKVRLRDCPETFSPKSFHTHTAAPPQNTSLFVHDGSKPLQQNFNNALPTEAVLLFLWIVMQRHSQKTGRRTWKLKLTTSRKGKYFTVYMRLLETFSRCKVEISSHLQEIVIFY